MAYSVIRSVGKHLDDNTIDRLLSIDTLKSGFFKDSISSSIINNAIPTLQGKQNIDRFISKIEIDEDFVTYNKNEKFVKKFLDFFNYGDDSIYNYDNVRNFVTDFFKKSPSTFANYHEKNEDDKTERNLKNDVFKGISQTRYENILSKIDFAENRVVNKHNLELINEVKDRKIRTDLFGQWVQAFKDIVNNSLKRGGVLPAINNFLYDSFQNDPESVNLILDSVDTNIKNQLFNELRRFVTVTPLLSNIHTSPVVPQKKLNTEDIKNALKFNNFDIEEVTKIRKKRYEKYSDTLKRSIEVAENIRDKSIPDQQIERVEISDEELAKKTYELNKKYHAGKHGEIGAQLIEEFNVNLTMGDWEQFRNEWKDKGDGILKPAFHGTNGTAASMILRFGFAVLSEKELKQAGGKYAGSMLGPGVYSAPNIDKVSNYIGDSNYGRLGSVGYLFEMDETLGQRNVHYRAAGLGNDMIRSPEYCAKVPREQIKIVKCYKAVKSSLKNISSNAKKYGVQLDEKFENQI